PLELPRVRVDDEPPEAAGGVGQSPLNRSDIDGLSPGPLPDDEIVEDDDIAFSMEDRQGRSILGQSEIQTGEVLNARRSSRLRGPIRIDASSPLLRRHEVALGRSPAVQDHAIESRAREQALHPSDPLGSDPASDDAGSGEEVAPRLGLSG